MPKCAAALKCKLSVNTTVVHNPIRNESGPDAAETSFLPKETLMMAGILVAGCYQLEMTGKSLTEVESVWQSIRE